MPLKDPAAPIKALSADMQTLHFKTQVIRFIRLFLTAFLTQVTFLPGAITWKALAALVPPSIEAVVREIWPSLSVDKLLKLFASYGKTPTPVPDSLKAKAVAPTRWATAPIEEPAPTSVSDDLLSAFHDVAEHLNPTGIPETPKPDITTAPPIDTSSVAAADVQFHAPQQSEPGVTDVPLPPVDDSPAAMPESAPNPAQ